MSKSSHSLKKGQKLELKIESIAAGGQGFSRCDGVSIFVDRGVPGDFAEIELYDVRKDFAHARITQVLEPSELRQEAPCKLFKVCGGCQWQHIDYVKQLELKTDIVRQVVKHIGGLEIETVRPAIGASEPFNYRNKVQFPVSSPNKSTRVVAGYYKEGSHELINVKHCPVQPEVVDRVMEAAKDAAEIAGLNTYNEATHTGLIRHFIARYSFSANEVLFILVLNAKPERFEPFHAALTKFGDHLMEEVPAVVGICINFNNQKGNRIMGQETKLLQGNDYLIETLKSQLPHAPEQLKNGIQFQLSPVSFFQVNSQQAVTLMDLVLEAVLDYKNSRHLDEVPLILDAFAGVASIAIWVSPVADKVLAVEQVSQAIDDAQRILELNSVDNVYPVCGTVEDLFPQFVSEGMRPQIVILDPPRKGVDPDALRSVVQLSPDRIIYVSCNPSTLARDLKILQEGGYKTRSIQPVDLFPQTFHIESVTVLDKA